jgi:hypothetical protein
MPTTRHRIDAEARAVPPVLRSGQKVSPGKSDGRDDDVHHPEEDVLYLEDVIDIDRNDRAAGSSFFSKSEARARIVGREVENFVLATGFKRNFVRRVMKFFVALPDHRFALRFVRR